MSVFGKLAAANEKYREKAASFQEKAEALQAKVPGRSAPAPKAKSSAAAAASGLQAGLVPVRLAGGGEEFGVNLKHVTEEAAVELLGKRAFDGEKRKTCVVFRDPTSQFRDSVRVETLGGHLVGWILKDDSKAVCQILDATTKALRKSKRSLRKQSFAFHISTTLEGEVFEGETSVDLVELRIKNPVTAELLDS